MAEWAFLASIGRINEHYRHASYGRLVVYELPELIEAPVMLFASLSLFNRASFPDTLKIFKGDQRRSVFSLRNQLFGDAVVRVSVEPSLFARKTLEMSFGTLRATALKVCLEVVYLGSNRLDLLSGEDFSGRIDSYVLDTKIDAKSFP